MFLSRFQRHRIVGGVGQLRQQKEEEEENALLSEGTFTHDSKGSCFTVFLLHSHCILQLLVSA